MKRITGLVLVLTVTGALLAGPAAAKRKPDACDLLTRKQVSHYLGFKVVATGLDRDKATGAEECEYRTKKYWSERFEDLDAPLKMQVTTQPLVPDLETALDTLEAEDGADTVEGLGDRAFYTDGNDLIAVVGDVVLQVEVTNLTWSGAELDEYVRGPEMEAMESLVDLFRDA